MRGSDGRERAERAGTVLDCTGTYEIANALGEGCLPAPGERAAERTLRRAGMTILDRRFRVRLGEIDLVARLGGLVVFVEVKTRRGRGFGLPAEAAVAMAGPKFACA